MQELDAILPFPAFDDVFEATNPGDVVTVGTALLLAMSRMATTRRPSGAKRTTRRSPVSAAGNLRGSLQVFASSVPIEKSE